MLLTCNLPTTYLSSIHRSPANFTRSSACSQWLHPHL